jgi:crotonobetainyl-CoA:carnitine CoA-transferase CaiB-like acyl-CoA transferase
VSNDPTNPAFAGLRVVELSQGMSGPLVGQLLADNGADVVKIEPPAGDWARSMPGFHMWNRGKDGVALDLSDDTARMQALALLVDADVLIDTVRGGTEHALGLAPDELSERFPRLVHLTITGFGLATGFEHLAPYEGVVAARIGRWLGTDRLSGLSEVNRGRGPIFNITPFGSYASACLGVIGIVGALRSREATGRGTHLETSLVDGIAAATMRMPFKRDGAQVQSVNDTKDKDVLMKGITLAFMTAECSDGRYVQMCARQPDHYKNWLRGVGLEHLLDDPRFANGPVGFTSLEDIDEIDALIRKQMIEHTPEHWVELFSTTYDVGADPFLTPAEFLEMGDMVDNGRVVEIDDPEVGHTTQVGPLALLHGSEMTIGRPAPTLGQHQARVEQLDTATVPSAPVAERITTKARPPLEGITVLECAYFIAGPMASSLLAELGARVIKVEPLTGDPFRATKTEFAAMAHGKESISVDTKSAEGNAILKQLIAKSDILLHSFRPGVPERLGLDYESVRAINPRVVYLYAGSYGSKGPQSQRPAFHSTPNAVSGAGIAQAGRGNPPVDDSYPDPCAALGAATGLAIGLHARERSGVGQSLETTMITSTGYVQSDMVIQYPGRPEALVPDHGQHGFHALYRLYPTVSGWLFVAAVQDKEWVALAEAVGHPEWVADERFVDSSSRLAHDDELIALLADALLARSADDWQELLSAAGVGAARADGQSFEEFLVGNTPHHPMTHPDFGDYWRRPPVIRFDGCATREAIVAPSVGEHTVALLTELGYSAEECRSLLEAGRVKAPPGAEVPA